MNRQNTLDDIPVDRRTGKVTQVGLAFGLIDGKIPFHMHSLRGWLSFGSLLVGQHVIYQFYQHPTDPKNQMAIEVWPRVEPTKSPDLSSLSSFAD